MCGGILLSPGATGLDKPQGTDTYPDISRHLLIAPGAGHEPVDVARVDVCDEALAQQICGAVRWGTGQDPGVLEQLPYLGGRRG